MPYKEKVNIHTLAKVACCILGLTSGNEYTWKFGHVSKEDGNLEVDFLVLDFFPKWEQT